MIDLNTIVLVVGFAITCVTFALGRKKDLKAEAQNDTKELTEIHSDIKSISEKVNSISTDLKEFKSNYRDDLAEIREKYDSLLQKEIKLEMRVDHFEKG